MGKRRGKVGTKRARDVKKGVDRERFSVYCEFEKADAKLGLVFGWAMVSKVDGEDYFDVQGDHIPQESMLKASAEFMVRSRVSKEMHRGGAAGSVVFAFPLTDQTADAFGITCRKRGLMIAVKPSSDEAWQAFQSGKYTGFSIGGRRVRDREVA